MVYAVRRSILLKALAFATLLAVSGLVAQELCHIQASKVYNDMVGKRGMSEKEARAIGAAHKTACVFVSCSG